LCFLCGMVGGIVAAVIVVILVILAIRIIDSWLGYSVLAAVRDISAMAAARDISAMASLRRGYEDNGDECEVFCDEAGMPEWPEGYVVGVVWTIKKAPEGESRYEDNGRGEGEGA